MQIFRITVFFALKCKCTKCVNCAEVDVNDITVMGKEQSRAMLRSYMLLNLAGALKE